MEAASELSVIVSQGSEFLVVSTFLPGVPRHHPPWFFALLSLDDHFVPKANRRQNWSDRKGLKVMKAWNAEADRGLHMTLPKRCFRFVLTIFRKNMESSERLQGLFKSCKCKPSRNWSDDDFP